MQHSVSHLTLTGYWAGRPLCDGVKDPTVTHYHAMYAPPVVLASPDTCRECLRLWTEPDVCIAGAPAVNGICGDPDCVCAPPNPNDKASNDRWLESGRK